MKKWMMCWGISRESSSSSRCGGACISYPALVTVYKVLLLTIPPYLQMWLFQVVPCAYVLRLVAVDAFSDDEDVLTRELALASERLL
jgi:hypothetical protein